MKLAELEAETLIHEAEKDPKNKGKSLAEVLGLTESPDFQILSNTPSK